VAALVLNAIVRERDAQGRGLVPPYYRSRIHVDFSSDDKFASSLEQLLRWPHDKPMSLDTLSALVAGLGREMLSGHFFLFVSGDRKRAEVLFFDGTTCLLAKRYTAWTLDASAA